MSYKIYTCFTNPLHPSDNSLLDSCNTLTMDNKNKQMEDTKMKNSRKNKRGQAGLEYSIVLSVVVAGSLAMGSLVTKTVKNNIIKSIDKLESLEFKV